MTKQDEVKRRAVKATRAMLRDVAMRRKQLEREERALRMRLEKLEA